MLSSHWATAADQALELLRRATDEQAEIAADAGSGLDAIWSWIVGSESSVAALGTNAAAARTLLATMEAKRTRLRTDDEAHAFIVTCGEYVDTSAIRATAESLSWTGGVAEIAGGVASDVAAGFTFASAGALGLGILVLVVLLARR